MRQAIPAAFGIFLAAHIVTTQTDSKDEVLKVEAAFSDAKIHNDVTALDGILAPDYVGINQWGTKRDKRAALQLFGRFPTTSLVPDHVSVQVSGDTATVDGIMAESSGGMQMKFLFLRTYVKRQGRWQLLSMAQIFSVSPSTMMVIDPASAGQ
jgi:hypothetical protein